MKSPAIVIYVLFMLVTAVIFAFVYGVYKNVVETYPVTFTFILITSFIVGTYGIADNIIFQEAPTKYTKK